MNTATQAVRNWSAEWVRAWDRFWFTAIDPATLGFIRILAGAMLFYTHAVWSRGLIQFFGPQSWTNRAAFRAFMPGAFAWSEYFAGDPAALKRAIETPGSFTWSYWWWVESLAGGSPAVIWTVHIAGLIVIALFTLGLWTRVTSILSFLIAVAYVNRAPGALFGLDQINCLLALYLAIGPSGAAYSLDNVLRRRRGIAVDAAAPRVGANIALRLLQLHMCVIYLFAGLAKLEGLTWQNGTAIWGAAANLEYQSIDLTWLAAWPILVNILTQVSVFWELTYAALVWPRLTRPIVILLAFPLHLGIALGMGMMTFGLIMIVGNLAFVSPRLIRAMLDPVLARIAARIGRNKAPAPASNATRAKAAPTGRRAQALGAG